MPQFEFANFLPQMVWLAIFFAILYFGVVRLTLPKVGRVMSAREDQVAGDLDTAEKAKAEADRMAAAYEADVAEAQAGARARLAEAQAKAGKQLEAKLAESNAVIEARSAKAQASLDAARDKAMGEIEGVAADAAGRYRREAHRRAPGPDRRRDRGAGGAGMTIFTLTASGPVASGNDNAVALTEADGTHGEGPELLGLNAEGWVYVGILIFLLLAIFVAKAPKRVTDILDQRIADTRRELDEAKAIRAEAEKLLADAKAKHAASAGDAAAIVAHAEQEAETMLAKAGRDTADLIERRGKMAEDKIAAAERAALIEVRARAADAATRAAAAIIAERHGAEADKPLIDRTIAGLGRPN